jgi:hypothetical protein
VAYHRSLWLSLTLLPLPLRRKVYAVSASAQRVCCAGHKLPSDIPAVLLHHARQPNPFVGCNKISIVAGGLSVLMLGTVVTLVLLLMDASC